MRSDLAAVQAFLASVIPGRTPIPEDPALVEVAVAMITGNTRLTPAAQVDIYRRQFWGRHRDVMVADLPCFTRVLGDGADAFFRAYLDAHPPTHISFRRLLDHVPRFAETFAGFDTEARRTLAVDMARYEIALLDVRTAADAPPLDPHKLASLPEDAWERARIVFHPALVRLAFSYPVHRLRKAWLTDEDMRVPDAPSPVFLTLYRTRELVTHFEELEPEAFALLTLLAEGEPLVPALGQVAEPLPEERQAHVASSVGRWFQQWTAWGIVVDVDLPAFS